MKLFFRAIVILAGLAILTAGCVSPKDSPKDQGVEHGFSSKDVRKSFSLMTYNVENFFDTQDDPAKNDQTFLPLAKKQSVAHKNFCRKISKKSWRDECLYLDWSEEVLEEKMRRLAAVIVSVNTSDHNQSQSQSQSPNQNQHPNPNQIPNPNPNPNSTPRCPDVLVLQEVENIEVLRRFNDKHLGECGYSEPILIEGHDKRGIDVAMLSRLNLVEVPQLREIPFRGKAKKVVGDSRGILKATFELGGDELVTVFGVHFPAPFHPKVSRIQAFKFLGELAAVERAKGRLVIAAGDFNVPSDEEHKISVWNNAAESECKESYRANGLDISAMATSKATAAAAAKKLEKCRGTTYYPPKKSWSFLDKVLVQSQHSKWQVQDSVTRVVNDQDFQRDAQGFPYSQSVVSGKYLGVSDHWPIVVLLKRN
ncbi:MAG: hypothetical protein COT74_02945 [Bdellovibrionales bacterium CG10_big_fil_rev_8_21_14_0_10_45_34]|nr:MAG: hypothetical protein COT74_02945 [Bdellovibrionales bacterium CG10_big_fil_rev_8_21_14_0_10_45_34]